MKNGLSAPVHQRDSDILGWVWSIGIFGVHSPHGLPVCPQPSPLVSRLPSLPVRMEGVSASSGVVIQVSLQSDT